MLKQVAAALPPALFLAAICLSFVRKRNPFSRFTQGCGDAVDLALGVFPYLVAALVCAKVVLQSGLSDALAEVLAPVLRFFGIPAELSTLLIVRPLSGSGSLALLQSVYRTYGVDSFVSLAASVAYGASESVLYLLAVYFCGGRRQCPPYAVAVALLSSFCGVAFGIFALRFV